MVYKINKDGDLIEVPFVLTPSEFDHFIKTIENPPKPNKKLIELMRKYGKQQDS